MSVVRNSIFKVLRLGGVPWILRTKKANQLTVLCFHRVTDEVDFFFEPIRPKDFETLLVYLVKNYSIVRFKDIHERTPRQKLILSFDDGYYDFVEYVLPLLLKYDLPCNLNLVNSCLNANEPIWTQTLNDIFDYLRRNSIYSSPVIEKYSPAFAQCNNNWMTYSLAFFKALLIKPKKERDSIINELLAQYPAKRNHRMMNWIDAELCAKNGIEIGSHSYTHDSLKTIESTNGLNLEVKRSVDEIEEKLNIKVNVLALPNGQYNKNVIDACAASDLHYVLATDNGTTSIPDLENKTVVIDRILMVNEKISEMILRSELFHTRLSKLL